MKVAILTGSIRHGRQSHQVGLFLEELIVQRNIEVSLIDLKEYPLPVLGSPNPHPEHVQFISRQFSEADSLLFVSPEYHGSFSGVIKNALDHFWNEFKKKPIGVVTVSSGKLGGINASTHLQHVILSLGAYPLPLKFLVPEVHNAFAKLPDAVDSNLIAAAKKFLDDFLWFADAIYTKKQSKLTSN
jgi:NAD(P)H-dependent FMN reductase